MKFKCADMVMHPKKSSFTNSLTFALMPLIREWEPDEHSLAAIWKIEEPEEFFALATGLESAIKSDKRRIERLAGRFLLQYLKADFPLHHIMPDEHDKPRIPRNQYYFSISHSYPYIAAMVSNKAECGIDIQVWRDCMEVVQHKFLSEKEQSFFDNNVQLITLAWCVKEAAYKWLGRRGIDFIEQLPIISFKENIQSSAFVVNAQSSEQSYNLDITGQIAVDFAIANTIIKK
jgi:phosphopantetheinyl transferase